MAAARPESPLVEVEDPNRLLIHPLAEVVPAMTDDEFMELRKSIRNRGYLDGEEIVLFEGKVLDGRHRLRASLAEGVEPRFRQYAGDDPEGYVVAKITRRDLDESRRAMVVASILKRQKEKKDTKWTHEQLGRMFGVGETIILEANRVMNNATPKLRRMVENGEVSMKTAEKVARLPVKEQDRVVASGADSVKNTAVQIRKGLVKPDKPADPEQPEFTPLTDELLKDLKKMAAKFTKFIRMPDGQRFVQYVQTLPAPGMIDFGRQKIVDKGEGLEKVHAAFTGLRELYRLVVASSRSRAYPVADLAKLMRQQEANQLDGDRPPPEPEHDPEQLVEPESL